MSVNRASTILNFASWILSGQWNAANSQSTHLQRLSAKITVTILPLPSTIECPRSINNFREGSGSCIAMMRIALFQNWVLRGQSFHYVHVYNFTNMHATSHRFNYFASTSRVNIQELAFSFTTTLLSAVSQVRLSSFQIPTAMWDSESFTTSLLQDMIASKNEPGVIRDLCNLTIQFIFDA